MKNKLSQIILACMLAIAFNPIAYAESQADIEDNYAKCEADPECARMARNQLAQDKIASDKAESEWKNNTTEKAFNVFSIPAIIIWLLYYFFWVKPGREEKVKINR